MKILFIPKKRALIGLAAAGSLLGGQAFAQDLYFIDHKPTNNRLQVCAGEDGKPVGAGDRDIYHLSCVQFEKIEKGDYFHIRSVDADKFLTPASDSNGADIVINPTSWQGDWTQWSHQDTGDGYGYIVHKFTNKHLFAGGDRSTVQLQPNSWSGDYTRFKFTPVDGGTSPTPPPATPTPASDVNDTVDIASTDALGAFLVAGADSDMAGFTLYTFNNDNGGPNSTCFDGCATVWPPYIIASADDLVSPSPVVSLGTTTRPDGSIQVTLNNEPLYFYQPDSAPGDTSGHGVGNVWWVADIGDATPLPTPSSTPSATPRPTPTPPSGPTPTPDPAATPMVPADDGAGSDFCLTYDSDSAGTVTHPDIPGGVQGDPYLCLNGCYPAALTDGVYGRGFDGLTPGNSYEIKTQLGSCNISATVVFQQGGSCVASSCLPPDEEAPTTPSGLQTEAKNGTAVKLDWSASTDNSRVTRYEIFRNGKGIDYVSSTTFNDSGLTPQTDYSYKVRACDAASNCSNFTPERTVNTGVYVEDVVPPTVPAGLTGEGTDTTVIELSWSASTDELGVVAFYRLTRDGTQIAEVNDLVYSDTGLDIGTGYSYAIAACDDAGNCSQFSTAVTVETMPPDFSMLDWESNSLISGKADGPLPRANPPRALPSPVNGAAPTSHGFAFDIDDSSVTWRPGGSLISTGEVEYYCSEDDGYTYTGVSVGGGTASNPCSGEYLYFFRYSHPSSLNNNDAHRWLYTAPFTTAGSRVDPHGYACFTDGSANWMRFRHPISQDGTTAAVLDAQHNYDRLRNLDRYTIWVDDCPGNASLGFEVDGNVIRVESHRSHGGPNGQQFFAVNQNPGFGGIFSYGQVVQFEVSAVAGATGAQTYNDFSYYTIGLGWGNYGDVRLNSAGRAGTTMIVSDGGAYIDLERNAIFTQPITTLTTEKDMDDFILGHHLFHGVDPNDIQSSDFDVVKIGERSCGDCHFRDVRGSEVIQTALGPRLPPATYGTGLLLAIEGRETGLAWDGRDDSMDERVRNAFIEDHGVNPDHLPGRVLELVTRYTEILTVPDRLPQFTNDPLVQEGAIAFRDAGCTDCHTPEQKTSSDDPAFDNLTIRPYTDMKLWDLGEGSFRTAPLWGLGQTIKLLNHNNREMLYMHDGGSKSVNEAVQRHNGSASSSKAAYNSSNSAAIDAFVNSL